MFSILHIAQMIKGENVPPAQAYLNDPAGPAGTRFLDKAKEALILGKYSNGHPYSVEASLTIAMWIYYQRVNRETEGWIVMGVCARLAMKQGYHRDPSVLKSLSPFEGEMRRRAFFFIETFDLLLSMQGGFPPMINQDECDTQPPSNLFDTDFNEYSSCLPPSRAETDHTPMLYFRYKSRLAKVFRKIYRLVLTLAKFELDNIVDLDHQLRFVREGIPPSLKFKPMSSSITDDSLTIISRTHCEQMFLKGLCILHRYYLTHERQNPAYEYSRRTCIDATLGLLDIQADLHAALQPQGQFCREKWMTTHITLHDFLLAAMVLCVEMRTHHENSGRSEDPAFHARKYHALQRAQGIWSSQADVVDEARRASKILQVVLAKLPAPSKEQADESGTPPDLPTPTKTPDTVTIPNCLQEPLQHDRSVIAPLTPPTAAVQPRDTDVIPPDPDSSFTTLFGEHDFFDWVSDTETAQSYRANKRRRARSINMYSRAWSLHQTWSCSGHATFSDAHIFP